MLYQCKLKFHFTMKSTNNTTTKYIPIRKYLLNKRSNCQEQNIKTSLQMKVHEKPNFLFPNFLKRFSFQNNCTGV